MAAFSLCRRKWQITSHIAAQIVNANGETNIRFKALCNVMEQFG